MYFYVIKNFRKRVYITGGLVIFWILMIAVSGFFVKDRIGSEVEINNSLKFSCPISLYISEVVINDKIINPSIQTNAAFTKPRIENFSTYSSPDGQFSFMYPSIFDINTKSFPGGEILYHIDLTGKNLLVHGLVQVWMLNESLESFLEKSKAALSQDVTDLNSEKTIINGMPGYIWSYNVKSKDGRGYKAVEAFLEKAGKMYRISYFVPITQWSNNQYDIFITMVKSLKVK